MMDGAAENKLLLKTLNSSGYGLQMAVKKLVGQSSTPWRVMYGEHPVWFAETKRPRYIDLILKKQNARLVVECKKRGGFWVFPVERDSAQPRTEVLAKLVVFPDVLANPNDSEVHLRSFQLDAPGVFNAEFCSWGGKKGNEPSTLDHWSSDLLGELDAFSDQEAEFAGVEAATKCAPRTLHIWYLAMIVTTARLMVCQLDPSDISMRDGELPTEGSEWTEVPWLCFRKPLVLPREGFSSLAELRKLSERTVIVANAARLDCALKAISVAGEGR